MIFTQDPINGVWRHFLMIQTQTRFSAVLGQCLSTQN